MFDPYPARPTLRLGVNLQEVKARHEERADIERQMKALSLRWTELTMLIETEHKQSQPIRVSSGICGQDIGRAPITASVTDMDFWDQRHRSLIQAAASGEIRHSAQSLRLSRLVHEPLYEDDGA